jgi:hypothetical protein
MLAAVLRDMTMGNGADPAWSRPSRQKYREGTDSHNVEIIVNGSA